MSTTGFCHRAKTDDGEVLVTSVAVKGNTHKPRVVLRVESAVYVSVLLAPQDAEKIGDTLRAAAREASVKPPVFKPAQKANGRMRHDGR